MRVLPFLNHNSPHRRQQDSSYMDKIPDALSQVDAAVSTTDLHQLPEIAKAQNINPGVMPPQTKQHDGDKRRFFGISRRNASGEIDSIILLLSV